MRCSVLPHRSTAPTCGLAESDHDVMLMLSCFVAHKSTSASCFDPHQEQKLSISRVRNLYDLPRDPEETIVICRGCWSGT